MSTTLKRHPIRGLFSGFFTGLGASLLAVSYGIVPFGGATVIVLLAAFTVLGVVLGVKGPMRKT